MFELVGAHVILVIMIGELSRSVSACLHSQFLDAARGGTIEKAAARRSQRRLTTAANTRNGAEAEALASIPGSDQELD
jgi:hypothetical protein